MTRSTVVILLHVIILENQVTSPKQVSPELLNKVVYWNGDNQIEHDNVSSCKIQINWLKLDICLGNLVNSIIYWLLGLSWHLSSPRGYYVWKKPLSMTHYQNIYCKRIIIPRSDLHPQTPYFHKQTVRCSSDSLCVSHEPWNFHIQPMKIPKSRRNKNNKQHTFVWHAQRWTKQSPFASIRCQSTKTKVTTA